MRCVAAVGGLFECGMARWEVQRAEEYVWCDGGRSSASQWSRRMVRCRSLVDGTLVLGAALSVGSVPAERNLVHARLQPWPVTTRETHHRQRLLPAFDAAASNCT